MPTKIEISLDAEKYRKELETLIGVTRQAGEKMSADLTAGTGHTGPAIAVTAEVSGREEVEKLAEAVEEIPAEKAVEVKIGKTDVSKLEWVQDAPDKTIQIKVDAQTDKLKELRTNIEKLPTRKTVTIPVETFGDKVKKGWAELRRELNDFSGGAKKLMSTVLGAGGGPIGIFAAGIASLFKIAGTYLNHLTEEMKESSEMAERNASSIAEAAAANEKQRQSAEGALRKLSELSNVEKMSNAQKTEAVSLITKLQKAYGDLGISIDRTSGKITGIDRAMVQKLQKDKDRRIKEMEAQLKELQASRNQQDEIISSESFWSRLLGGGTKNTEEAAQKREALMKQIRDLTAQLNEERKSSAAEDYLQQRSASNADVAAGTVQRHKNLEERKWQDQLADTEKRDDKIDLLDKRLQQERAKLKQLQTEAREAKGRIQLAESPGDRVEAERISVEVHAKVQAEKEKIYDLERQIKNLETEEAKAIREKLEQEKFELDYTRLIAAGEYDKAAALKQEHELRRANLQMTEEESKKSEENRKRLRELNLKISQRDKAMDLKWQMMEKAGQGKEAAELRALRDAEQRKGGKLTDSERDSVSKLADLTWKMQNLPQMQMGDLSIKTNSLTSRGGFQGGAVLPDKDQVNKAISVSVKQTYERLGEITTFLDQLNDGLRGASKISMR